jgi:hypothetical protein
MFPQTHEILRKRNRLFAITMMLILCGIFSYRAIIQIATWEIENSGCISTTLRLNTTTAECTRDLVDKVESRVLLAQRLRAFFLLAALFTSVLSIGKHNEYMQALGVDARRLSKMHTQYLLEQEAQPTVHRADSP